MHIVSTTDEEEEEEEKKTTTKYTHTYTHIKNKKDTHIGEIISNFRSWLIVEKDLTEESIRSYPLNIEVAH